MTLQNTDYKIMPKFRHNLWTSYEDNPAITILSFSQGEYEVPTSAANKFIKIRSYCTGYNDVADIAEKSRLSVAEVLSIIQPLIDIDMLHRSFKSCHELSHEIVLATLMDAARIWGEQLADTSISREIFLGKTSKNVLLGWLLETYHYVKEFPQALDIAASAASGELKTVLEQYAKQERGHEEFIAKCLVKAGLSHKEIAESIPLVSTRLINLLLKEIFGLEPLSALVIASIVEASEFDDDNASFVAREIAMKHQLPVDLFDTFLQHIAIDDKFGHQKLFNKHKNLFMHIDKSTLHDIVNKTHDIKHAFDVQKLEIKEYYDKLGNYFPRQRVDFFAI